MVSGQKLFLITASKSRGGKWNADDYDVRLGSTEGHVVGRIFKPPMAKSEEPWFWTITDLDIKRPLSDRGYAATRESAMAAFRSGYFGEGADTRSPVLSFPNRNSAAGTTERAGRPTC
jgi:hypothetical protein